MVREQVVRVDELSRHFGDKVAVDRVSFDIARSEVFGFLGPNGAGKTTTIKMLTTLLPPTSGRATVLGHDLRTEGRKIRAQIGVVQQQDRFDQGLTVETSIDIYGVSWNVPKAERRRRIDELIGHFEMEEFRKMPQLTCPPASVADSKSLASSSTTWTSCSSTSPRSDWIRSYVEASWTT